MKQLWSDLQVGMRYMLVLVVFALLPFTLILPYILSNGYRTLVDSRLTQEKQRNLIINWCELAIMAMCAIVIVAVLS